MNEGAPIQGFDVPVSALSIAHLNKICPNVDGAFVLCQSTGTYWSWVSVLPGGVVSSADGTSGATTSSPGGFWVNTGLGPTGASGTAQAQVRYVSKGGNDATGDGSFAKPFLTVQAAITSITDATSAKPYMVSVGPGIFATAFVLSPFVFVVGSGVDSTSLAPTAAQCLGAGFAVAAAVSSGISNANITTNLVADFNAIGSTGAGKVFFERLVLQGVLTLTGAAAANYAFLDDLNWLQFNAKALTITNMSNVDMFNVHSSFGPLVINGDDTAFRDVQGYGCSGFSTLTIAWTGAAANANNALDVVFDASPQLSSSGSGGAGQPTVTGLGAIFDCPNGIKLTSVAADAAIQFNRFLGAGSVGVAGDVIGVDGGQNHVICNAPDVMTLTLRKALNGTRVKVKNQSSSNVTLNFNGLGVTGDPSYIGPFGYADMFFSSGTWMVQEQLQTGTVVLAGGVSAFIPADVSGQSSIVATLKTFNGAAGTPSCNGADRVSGTKGTGGGFKVHAINLATGADLATDNGTYDWFVFPGKA